MSQEDLVLASELVLGGATERSELLRLFARRNCPKKNRISGPFSRSEAALLKRGEKVLAIVWESHRVQAAERAAAEVEEKRRLPEAARIVHRAAFRKEFQEKVRRFVSIVKAGHPSWSAERIQRKAIRQAQMGQCLVFIVQRLTQSPV